MKESEDVRSLKIALGAYILVFALKLAVYFMSGVLALMAEAFHTLSDILVTSFLLLAAYYSRKAADQVHMFGYGRAQNVAALVAATLFISFTSYKLYEEAIPRLFAPVEVPYQNLELALGVLVLSMFIAAVPLINLFRQKQRGPAARAQFLESINDELGLIAALIGTLFILWGQPIADPIASIVVATIIAYNGLKLFLENFSFLLGRSPGSEYLSRLEQLARSVPGVIGVHELRAEYIGPDVVHAGMHIEVQPGITIEEAERIRREVDVKVHQGISAGYCVIQVEPAAPRSLPGTEVPVGETTSA
ncbi:MAG TPA: cation diffusion facilitator family transporter [Anaerolineales bacterium]|nr:cation diffusion facilitator family transporter [Anaerolineales bacterium]